MDKMYNKMYIQALPIPKLWNTEQHRIFEFSNDAMYNGSPYYNSFILRIIYD